MQEAGADAMLELAFTLAVSHCTHSLSASSRVVHVLSRPVCWQLVGRRRVRQVCEGSGPGRGFDWVPPVLFLRHRHELLHGGGQTPSCPRAVGGPHEGGWRKEGTVAHRCCVFLPALSTVCCLGAERRDLMVVVCARMAGV
jgi:hypothetical protein